MEPTNNVAERTLRTAVQWRKISFGNRSRNGEIATARLLTVAQTCKRQQRHVLGYLTDAVRCHRRQTAAPSLLPRRPSKEKGVSGMLSEHLLQTFFGGAKN